jgi:prepilin-type N-terminal cleavage/methylation domain-containing protein
MKKASKMKKTIINKKHKAFTIFEMSIVILIVGIIAAGISQGYSLHYKYTLTTARSLSKSASLSGMPGLVLWLDASAENSLTNVSNSFKVKNNDFVKTWIDQNPQFDANNRFTFTQKGSSEGPIFIEKGINNLPTLYFDFASSAGDGLYLPFSPILNPTEFTIFIVTKPIQNTGDWESLIASKDAVTSPGFMGFNLYKNNASELFEFWTGNSASWDVTQDAATFSFNTPYILSMTRGGVATTDNSILYKNGSQVAITSDAAFSPNNSRTEETATFCIGNSPGSSTCSGTQYYDGYISEIIMYNRALLDKERQDVEKYLSQKYKINLS